MEKEFTLSGAHQSVWNELRDLKDGERILGANLQTIVGITDKRHFMSIIEDLRDVGLFISGSKSEPRGYSEIRDTRELAEYLQPKRNEHIKGLRNCDKMEANWYRRQAERMKMDGK